MALIDELGFVQLPKTSVKDSKGNEISVEIIHDTVIAEAVCRHRDNLLITKNRFRSEFKSEQTSTERVITAPVKRCPLFKLFIIGLIVGVICTCLFLFFRKRYSLTPKT
jgi:subtilase family serine protease